MTSTPTTKRIPTHARQLLTELTRLEAILRELTASYDATSHASASSPAAHAATIPSTIHCPADIAAIFHDLRYADREQVHVLLLNARNRVIDRQMIYQGTVHSCSVRPSEILRPAVLANATAFVIVHTHPSGDPEPSPEDIHLSRRLLQAGKLLDIELVDSIIIAADTTQDSALPHYISLQEKGQLG